MQTVEQRLEELRDAGVVEMNRIAEVTDEETPLSKAEEADFDLLGALNSQVYNWINVWRLLPSEVCPEADALLARGLGLATLYQAALDFLVPAKEGA